MYLAKDEFANVIKNTPLISIDLLIKNDSNQFLLGLRNNRPAKDYWFVLGGRVFKDESLDNAFKRISETEVGVELERESAIFRGVYEHLYDDYAFGEDGSTHYVVLAYELTLNIDLLNLPKIQHGTYKWFTVDEALLNKHVHKYSKWYLS
jgi:colanic acid biosynthesis protein WcaH